MDEDIRYHVFISYTHNDGPRKEKNKWIYKLFDKSPWASTKLAKRIKDKLTRSYDYKEACRLEKKLKRYHFPKDIASDEKYAYLKDVKRVSVYRDETEQQPGPMRQVIFRELDRSQHLVVISSKHSRKKPWVNDEVSHFLANHNVDHLTPFAIDGIPFSKRRNEQEIEESIPSPIINIYEQQEKEDPEHDQSWYCLEKSNESFSKILIRILGKAFDVEFDELWKSEKRRIRRRQLCCILIGAIITAAASWIYFDKFHTYTEYYVKTVDRYGVPVGLHKLKKEETNCYLSHVMLQKRNHKVIRATSFDCYGGLTEEGMKQGIHDFFDFPGVVREFSYNDNTGELESVTLKNHELESVCRLIYHAKDLIELRMAPQVGGEALNIVNKKGNHSNFNCFRTKLNERGETIQLYCFQNSKENSITAETPNILYQRDSIGRINQLMVGNSISHSILIAANTSLYKLVCKYDKNSSAIYTSQYDKDNNMLMNEDWSFQTKIIGQGSRHFEIRYEDAQGKLCYNDQWVAKGTIDIIKGKDYSLAICKMYNTKNERTLNKDNVSMICRYDYNNGKVVRCFYDIQNKPICSKEDCHREVEEYKQDTLVTTYYDTQGRLCNNYTIGYAIKKEFTDTNCTTTEYFDKDGERCGNREDGIAILQTFTNQQDDVLEIRLYSSNRTPTCGIKYDAPVYKMKYDNQGNRTEIRYENGYGKPYTTSKSYAYAKFDYDQWGNCTKESFYDSNGNACLCDNKYATILKVYNNVGQLVKELKYDENNRPLENYSEEYTLDKWGNITEMQYKDSLGKLYMFNNSYAIIKQSFSKDGLNILSQSYYDTIYQPATNENGIHQSIYKYDNRHNRTEISNRNIKYEPTPDEDGITRKIAKYNDRNLLIEKRNYNELDTTLPMILEKNEYDEFGELIEKKIIADNKIELITVYERDRQEYSITTKFLTGDRNLIKSDTMPAIQKRVYNSEHYLIKNTFYDYKHHLFFMKNNFAFAHSEIDYNRGKALYFDADSLLIRIEYIQRGDNKEQPVPTFCWIEIKRPSANIELEEYYTSEKLKRGKYGAAVIKRIFNNKHQEIEEISYDEYGNRCNNIHGYSKKLKKYNTQCPWPSLIEYLDSLDRPIEVKDGYTSYYKQQIAYTINDSIAFFVQYNTEMYPLAARWITHDPQKRLINAKIPNEYYSWFVISYDKYKRLVNIKYYDIDNQPTTSRFLPQEAKYVYANHNSKCPIRIDYYNVINQLLSRTIVNFKDSIIVMQGVDDVGNPITVDYAEYFSNDEKDKPPYYAHKIEYSKVYDNKYVFHNSKLKKMKSILNVSKQIYINKNDEHYSIPNLSILEYQLARQIFGLRPIDEDYRSTY